MREEWKGRNSLRNFKKYVKVIRFFCDMNNVQSINWKIIYRGLTHVKQHSDDRNPPMEEITKLVDFDIVIRLTVINRGFGLSHTITR